MADMERRDACGRPQWYMKCRYGFVTLFEYLRLGLTLGAVQVRHTLRLRGLALRLWLCHALLCLCACCVHLCAPRRGSVDADAAHDKAKDSRRCSRDTHATTTTTTTTTNTAACTCTCRAHTQQALSPPCLSSLLRAVASLVQTTHGESVHVRLLALLQRQAIALQAHTDNADYSQHHNTSNDDDSDDKHHHVVDVDDDAMALPHDALFVLASSDATYAATRAAQSPVCVTYRDAIALVTLLSQVLAWELFLLHYNNNDNDKDSEASDVDVDTIGHDHGDAAAAVAAAARASTRLCVQPTCVALLLPNSVEYNLVWLSCVCAGPWHTFLDVLYSYDTYAGSGVHTHACAASSSSLPSSSSSSYRPCRVALINTNVANNDMLHHALACAGCVVVVMDVQYAHLLFADDTTAAKGDNDEQHATTTAARRRVRVPPCVRRIFVWRDRNTRAASTTAASTCLDDDMRAALDAFNARAYATLPSSLLPPPPPPLLDLQQLVSRAASSLPVMRGEAATTSTVVAAATTTTRHDTTGHCTTPSTCAYLAARIRATSALPWCSDAHHVDKYSNGNSDRYKHSDDAVAADATSSRSLHHLLHVVRRRVSASTMRARNDNDSKNGDASNADDNNARVDTWRVRLAQRQWQAALCRRLARVLSQFEPTQAMLFIYTSGTTGGLPKAARFSHLRFFATCYLSRLMRLRTRTMRVLQHQRQQEQQHDDTCEHVAVDDDDDSSSIHARSRAVHGMLRRTLLLLLLRRRRCCYSDGTCVTRRLRQQQHERERELSCLTVYNCLPMYHTVGCVFCLGHLMHALEEQQAHGAQGCTAWWRRWSSSSSSSSCRLVPTARMVLRTRFSASCFVADLQRYHVTVVQYIGEILRYATLYERGRDAQQQQQQQQGWCVPYAFGNGLRGDIWHECLSRLHIAQPLEFYSSTEGNIFLFNLFNIPGAMGHMARFPWPLHRVLSFQHLVIFPFRVVRYDEVAQDVWRDAASGYGACVGVGEAGEVLGEIVRGFDVFGLRRFDGYHAHTRSGVATAAASAAVATAVATGRDKVLRHVLWPFAQRAYFRSGDLVRFDEYGFCTFVDRVGETFRWKGENVSTVEVSNALQRVRSSSSDDDDGDDSGRGGGGVAVQEAVVYGVQVPGCEGRAGMARLRLRDGRTAAPPSTRRERLFMQNELYGLLCGTASTTGGNNDNSDDMCAHDKRTATTTTTRSSAPLLPSYAIPLFVRVDDDDNDDGCSNAHDTAAATTTTSAAVPSGDATMTTTFKYRKYVLIRQGYDYVADDANVRCAWGECDGDRNAPDTCRAPRSREYVLVRRPGVWSALVTPPAPPPSCGGCYVPLTCEVRRVLGGATLCNCGW